MAYCIETSNAGEVFQRVHLIQDVEKAPLFFFFASFSIYSGFVVNRDSDGVYIQGVTITTKIDNFHTLALEDGTNRFRGSMFV